MARRHGLRPQQVFAWRREARERAEGDAAFAAVVVGAAEEPRPAAPVIEVALGGATVRVPAGADAATLKAVLRAVKAVT